MKYNRFTPLLGLALFLGGCDSAPVVGPPAGAPEASFHVGAPAHGFTLLNWNMYLGADASPVIAALESADASDDLPALLAAIATFAETHFPARAAAIAGAIKRNHPAVVGLQEVWDVEIDLTGLGLSVEIDVDFLAVLQAELAARGLPHTVAVVGPAVEVSVGTAIQLVDRDVILVDPGRVSVLASGATIFTNNAGVVAPGVTLKRGWVEITAEIGGRTYAVVNTHLESGVGPAVSALRAAQALELASAFGDATIPVIMMGDFNDTPGSAMHQALTGAGFTDVWAALRPHVAGFTCCHLEDLSNRLATFDKRIDYVFARGVGHPIRGVLGRIMLVGDLPRDRISGPDHKIWPSDHAGLVAALIEPPAHGLR
jgi:hypothetical protein